VRPPAFRRPDPRADARTTARREAPTPPPSKPHLDGYRTRHDALPEARFARTVVYSVVPCTIPPHVAKLCGAILLPPPPWPIKGGGNPPVAGDDRQRTLTHFPPSPRYWHFALIKPQGPGGLSSSPASLVSPLCKHHGATQYSASSTPLLDVRPRPEPG
jgi:hypothetical protein